MLWVKTFHILSVMAWLVGIFYLPRILVHYAEGTTAGEDVRRLKIMAEKLLQFMTIMASIAIILGLYLWLGYSISGAWLEVKLVFVITLIFYHLACWWYVKKMAVSEFELKGKFFRYFNELSLIAVIPILIMVVVKPI